MKRSFVAVGFFSVFSIALSHAALAHDACTVIGFHEPHTQIYDGPTFCTNVSIHNIDVRGPLTISGSRMYGTTKVSGPVTASYTCFDRIDVKNNGSQNHVILSDDSVIKGNLVFEGEAGIYTLDNTSVIYGNVINGSPSQTKVK